MKTLLLANQPTKTTRLLLFQATLTSLGHEVIVPSFSSTSWIAVSQEAGSIIRSERPDIVHIFNVPDVIYRKIPAMKGRYFDRLIYDYRSPWGVEMALTAGAPANWVGEYYERLLARGSDAITSVNTPLAAKVAGYCGIPVDEVAIIPNYPSRTFIKADFNPVQRDPRAVLFVGRISGEEGAGNLIRLARRMPDFTFKVVGSGPLSRWYLNRSPQNLISYGWQPHERIPELVRSSGLCLIPFSETFKTCFTTDLSVWKLNEYLNLGGLVLASGIIAESPRKNLKIVPTHMLEEGIRSSLQRDPEPLIDTDYRFWEGNTEIIRNVYESVQKT